MFGYMPFSNCFLDKCRQFFTIWWKIVKVNSIFKAKGNLIFMRKTFFSAKKVYHTSGVRIGCEIY